MILISTVVWYWNFEIKTWEVVSLIQAVSTWKSSV